MSELRLSCRQVGAAGRILDRHGPARASLNGSALVMFLGADDGPAELLVRVGPGGELLMAHRLSQPEPEPEDDLDDLSEETPLEPAAPATVHAHGEGARASTPCQCTAPRPSWDDAVTCGACGRRLVGARVAAGGSRPGRVAA